ncbi:MAG TPA: ferritin-like domain-containing protein [Gaiellaceae bacterium]|nr:ferritin-like domain-containing protein [Gaiellaceae bacterium]
MDRRQLLQHGLAGGVVLAGGGVLAAAAAAAPPDGDLASLRIAIAAELLKLDFAAEALAGGSAGPATVALLKGMRADDTAHANGLASLLTGAGQTPATADDIDFSYPSGSFASDGSIAKLAGTLTALTLGAYLGALESLQTPRFRLAFAQIAANEAQQASAAAAHLGRPAVGAAFAAALDADQVTTALDRYES